MLNYIKMMGFVSVGLAIMFAFNHYTSILNEKDNLEIEKRNLELALKSEQEVNKQFKLAIEEWKDSNKKILNAANELRQISINANREVNRLNGIFAKHDIGKLAEGKPSAIENVINNGTADAFKLLECSSGSTDKSCAGEY